MTHQPVPNATDEDVQRVVMRDFPAQQVAEVLAILHEYGPERWHNEPQRVRLAALKLANGDVERLRHEIDCAKRDYRDILSEAEYPRYTLQGFGVVKLPPEQQRRIIDADWQQYRDWLNPKPDDN